jgi:excisionase family DNA binding protein
VNETLLLGTLVGETAAQLHSRCRDLRIKGHAKMNRKMMQDAIMVVAALLDQPALPEGYVTVDEIAHSLRVSRMTIYRAVNDGKIAHTRVGRQIRVQPTAVADWLVNQ